MTEVLAQQAHWVCWGRTAARCPSKWPRAAHKLLWLPLEGLLRGSIMLRGALCNLLNFSYNNVLELLGLLIHKWRELYRSRREHAGVLSLKCAKMPALATTLAVGHSGYTRAAGLNVHSRQFQPC
jgi:hypothetical protein